MSKAVAVRRLASRGAVKDPLPGEALETLDRQTSPGDAAREDDRAPEMHAPARADLHDSPSDPYVFDTGVQHDGRTGGTSLGREPLVERRAIQDRDVLPRTLKLGHRPVRGHDET